MTPFSSKGRRARALLAAMVIAVAAPAATIGAQAHPNPATPYVSSTVAGAIIVPLINSGQTFDGETFEGIPDGLGIVPVGNGKKFIDIYVAFEQSHVPFSGFADFEDSSVQVARLDLQTRQIVSLEEVLPASAGYIRFCSAFMAGPEEGFGSYTFFVNEESNDVITVPAGAQYGADPHLTPYRQAGYSVWIDTKTGAYKQIPGLGRHNHENTVIIPGGWDDIVALSGDDTFTAPSSQLYMYTAANPGALKQDKGSLWAFQVTGVNGTPLLDPSDEQNNANDFLEIAAGNNYQGRFIPVPPGIAKGIDDYPDGSNNSPQTSLEAWSNDSNVFQFVRVEDIASDPDHPREVYFTDTGTTRLKEDAGTGRLFRELDNNALKPWTNSNGRVFKMVMNANSPTVVDSLSILAEGSLTVSNLDGTTTTLVAGVGIVNPDNIDVSHASLMVQEDASSANDVWQHSLGTTDWRRVATITQGGSAETSGIVDASQWLGDGWWVLDVQSHVNLPDPNPGPLLEYQTLPTGPVLTYQDRREDGQLLLLFIPGS